MFESLRGGIWAVGGARSVIIQIGWISRVVLSKKEIKLKIKIKRLAVV